jgi:hypothetical protein
MNRTATRAFLGLSALASVAGFAYAANPRIVAFNQVSSAATIAQQRAATCVKVANQITPNTRVMAVPVPGQPDQPMTAGTLICDGFGATAEVTTGGRVHYIRTAPPELLNQILDKRGTPTAPPAIPSASPVPPTNPR